MEDRLDTLLVPPGRLGALLADARVRGGVSLEELADCSRGEFTLDTLNRIELGELFLEDTLVQQVTELYGVEFSRLVPQRSKLVVDLNENRILMGDDDGTVVRPRKMRKDDVLPKYLAMVYTMRELEPGTRIPLRIDDIEVLGTALHMGRRAVEGDLKLLMANPRDLVGRRHRLLRSRVLVPAAGVLVAISAAGALLLVSDFAGASAADGSIAQAVVQERLPDGGAGPVEVREGHFGGARIGDAVVQERLADGSAGPVMVRNG